MEISREKDEKYMRLALEEAKLALEADEVPIGAVIIADGYIVGRGHNLVETLTDVTAHAEIQAITAASSTIGGKYLNDCTLYVTVEPCPMCAGAIINSRLDRVVFGAKDPRMGALGSVINLNNYPLGHKVELRDGVLAEESLELLRDFFKDMREGK